MAQYNIRHTCGHEETVQIYGTNVHGERTRKAEWLKAEWLESKPCRDCERKAMRDENLTGAAELTGSDKQVNWANDLRAKAIGDIKAKLAKIDTQYIAAPQEWKDAQRKSRRDDHHRHARGDQREDDHRPPPRPRQTLRRRGPAGLEVTKAVPAHITPAGTVIKQTPNSKGSSQYIRETESWHS